MIDIIIKSQNILIGENVFPVSIYYNNKILDFENDDVLIGDEHYHIKLYLNFNDFNFRYYVAKKVGDDEIVERFKIYAGDFIKKRGIFVGFDDLEDSVYTLQDYLDEISNNISEINTNFVNKCNEIKEDISNIDFDCDLSSIENKIKEISTKVDILDVFEISQKIDEKLSQIFNLKSLNGSNGSKFKDGSIVKIKGYDGDWKVDGSYPLLNSDGVTIIVYKVVQDDRVLLAPSPFVEV